jgi:hypothetical protein
MLMTPLPPVPNFQPVLRETTPRLTGSTPGDRQAAGAAAETSVQCSVVLAKATAPTDEHSRANAGHH